MPRGKSVHKNNRLSKENKEKTLQNNLSVEQFIMLKSTENSKEKYSVALDREIKRISVIYPFLSKSLIRNRARQELANRGQVSVPERPAKSGTRGKTALKFVTNENSKHNEEKIKNKNRSQESKKDSPKMEDEDSDDPEFADPTYYPTAKERMAKAKPNSKNGGNKKPKVNGNNRRQAQKGTKCDFMELGGNCFTENEELEPFKVTNLSKSILSSNNHVKKSMTATSKQVTKTCEDDMFDIWMMEDNKCVSESPGSILSTHLSNSSLEISPILDSVDHPSFMKVTISEKRDSVDVTETEQPRKGHQENEDTVRNLAETNINASKNRLQSVDVISNASTNQQRKARPMNGDSNISRIQNANTAQKEPQFVNGSRNRLLNSVVPKCASEDGIEVITLSSDSEDDDIIAPTARRTTKERYHQLQLLSIKDIKIEKGTPALAKPGISRAITRFPEIVPRSILKPAPRIGTPKQDMSTQMTPPRSINGGKQRPQMLDQATETDVELEEHVDSSSDDSRGAYPFQTRYTSDSNWMEKLLDTTPRIKLNVGGFSRGTSPSVRSANWLPETTIPKVNSIQTQTDALLFQEPGPGRSASAECRSVSNMALPKRFVSWKDDQVGQLVTKNDKTRLTSTQAHGFSHIFPLDFESEKSNQVSTKSTSTQTDNTTANEIHTDELAESDFDAEDEKLANAWFYVFNSPIKPIVPAGTNTEGSNLDSKRDSTFAPRNSPAESPVTARKNTEKSTLNSEIHSVLASQESEKQNLLPIPSSDDISSSRNSSEESFHGDLELEKSILSVSSGSQPTPTMDFNLSGNQTNVTTGKVGQEQPSLLELWLEKMRTFGPNLGIKEEVISTPSRFGCPDPLLSVDLLKKKPVPVKRAEHNPATQVAPMDQSNFSCKTPVKADLLCDLFDVATPKSTGGTINRFLSYSNLQSMQRFEMDEDCSSFFC